MANYLPVPYYKQNKVGYCLAACAQMVLDFQGVSRSQDILASQLQMKQISSCWPGSAWIIFMQLFRLVIGCESVSRQDETTRLVSLEAAKLSR